MSSCMCAMVNTAACDRCPNNPMAGWHSFRGPDPVQPINIMQSIDYDKLAELVAKKMKEKEDAS